MGLLTLLTLIAVGGLLAPAGASTRAAKPVSGGTLTIGVTGEIPTMDPVRGTVGSLSAGGDRLILVMGTLLNHNTKTGEVIPGLAESLTTRDGMVWTLKLRPNLKFSDGTPYDANAVVFHFERLKDPANAYAGSSIVNQIIKMTALDSTTVEFKLANVNGSFPLIFTDTAGSVGSPTAIKADPRNWGQKPVGAGAYLLKEWVRDSQYTFVRNPAYFDKPRPYIDTIVVKVITNRQTLATSLQQGVLDVVHTATDAAILGVALKDPKNFRAYDPKSTPGAVGVVCNLERAPCTDTRFREALSLAFDYNAAKAIWMDGVPAPERLECPPWGPGSPFCNKKIVVKYNPDKAKKLVDAVKADGINTDVVHMFNFDGSDGLAHGEFVQQAMAKIGVKVTLRPVTTAEYTPAIVRHDYQMAVVYNPTRSDMTSRYLNDWHSSGGVNGGRDVANTNNAALDVALEKGRNSVDLADQIAGIKEAQRILFDEKLVFWIRPFYTGHIARTTLQLASFQTPSAAQYRYESAWIKSAKR